MPEDVAAVVDAPVETPAVESTPEVSTPSNDTPSDTPQIDSGDTPQPGEAGHLRGAELYRAVKDQLKSLDPKLAKSVRAAIHIAAQADKAVGGDLGRFESERAAYSKLADDPEDGLTPEQRVESILEERNFWRDFDDRFEKADPATIEKMHDANPGAFQNLIVPAVNKFASVNPEGYSSLIAKATTQYLAANNLPLQLQILDTFLPMMPEFAAKQQVLGAINHIKSLMGALDDMASKPIAAKVAEGDGKPNGGINQNPDHLAERELSITRREWQVDTERPGIELRNAEMSRIAAQQKATLTDGDRQKIRVAVNEEINARLAADTKYGQAMRGYLQAGNRQAYRDRALSEYKKLIPSVTRRHTQAVIDEKKAAPVAKVDTQPGKTAQPLPKPTQDASGNLIQWIAGPPRTVGKQVDYLRTTNSMLQRNEAYIKGEKGLFKWKTRTN